MTSTIRLLARLGLSLVILSLASAARAQVCSPQILQEIRRTGTGADMAALDVAMARLNRIESMVGADTWDRVARNVISVVDANAVTPITIQHWVQLTLQGTDEEIAAVIKAADRLVDSGGNPFPGLFTKTGAGDGSSSWLINAKSGNRGYLYEVVGVDALIRSGYVSASNVEGMGIRILNSEGRIIEGDLVERMGSGRRFIDLKALDGNYSLDELDRINTGIRDHKIQQFVFAYEAGTAAPSSWLQRVTDLNVQLVNDGFGPIELRAAGPFQP